MAKKGFKLTMPNGDVFNATENVVVRHDTEDRPFAQGGENLVALWKRFIDSGGTSGRFDSQKQIIHVSLGAGIHRYIVQFRGATGNTGSDWGGAPSDASARTKVDYLDESINTQVIDSNSPATYEGGEFSTSGDFNPVDVGIEQASIEPDFDDPSPSTFSGQLMLIDIASLQQAIDNQRRQTDR